MSNCSVVLSNFRNLYHHIGEHNLRQHYELLYFAYFAYFAYCDYGYISQSLFDISEKYKIISHNSSSILIVEFDEYNIVSFRGMCPVNFSDLRTIFTLSSKTFYNIQAHRGFVGAVNALVPYIIDAAVEQNKPLFFAGHSMGAALSSLTAICIEPDIVYMYGPPKFVKRTYDIDKITKRVVNGRDFVTKLPPFTFKHIGEHIRLDTADNLFTAHYMRSYIKSLHNFYNLNFNRR